MLLLNLGDEEGVFVEIRYSNGRVECAVNFQYLIRYCKFTAQEVRNSVTEIRP